jgi:hypothetical protein
MWYQICINHILLQICGGAIKILENISVLKRQLYVGHCGFAEMIVILK